MLRTYLVTARAYCCSSKARNIEWNKLKFESKVPSEPVKSKFSEKVEKIKITEEEINLLEKLSLVDLERKNAVKVLEDSIEFASRIHNIETTDEVKPLYTVLEDYQLQLREDKITDGNIKQEVMKNAVKTDEETYFITPNPILQKKEPHTRMAHDIKMKN